MELKLVEEWKETELENYKERYQNYLKERENLKKEYDNLCIEFSELRAKLGNPDRVGDNYYNKKYENEELESLYKKRENAHYSYVDYAFNKNQLFSTYGHDEIRWKKEIDKRFKKLQAKVETKIGEILKIEHLGGDDYLFEGKEAHCKVEVIMAGGYNIQRLHTRWVVKDIWKD
ncbi:hypothetical protein [uncultured Clostridium sp.]|uniref:hypothetical protein n=1 Tax=uncultured Clostridium sp. TaxID=59620 RepID=UPI002615D241|nr:hypothetical protein [uncultured Clostridium sp.]